MVVWFMCLAAGVRATLEASNMWTAAMVDVWTNGWESNGSELVVSIKGSLPA